MAIRGLLFDFNGTLFFDSRMHLDAFKALFPIYGKKVPSDEEIIRNLFGRTNEQICLEQFKENATKEECEEYGLLKEKLYFENCLRTPEAFRLVDGAPELLSYLVSHDIPFCLATGSGKMNMDFYMEHLDIGRWFSYDKNIIYSNGTFRGKPAPDCYRLAAEKIGLSPSECAVFEDGTSGLRAAHAAGAGATVAIWEEGIPSPITPDLRPDAVVHDLKGWRELLRMLGF